MSSTINYVLLLAIATYASAQLNGACEYEIYGKDFRAGQDKPDSQTIALSDGTLWWLDSQGLHIAFNNTRMLYAIAAQTSSTKKLRVMSFNKNHKKFILDKAFESQPQQMMKANFNDELVVADLVIHGFTKMDIMELEYLIVTACPMDCPSFVGCYGDCEAKVFNNCMQCICPPDSHAAGCTGYENDKDLNLLMALAMKHVFGCQFVYGFRRMPSRSPGFAPCVEYNYPLCRWYRPIKVPRTRQECETSCT